MQLFGSQGWLRFAGMHVVLLQGPHGPFFKRVADALHHAGAASVTKIDFNGGDALYSAGDAIAYTGSPQDWPAFFAKWVQTHQIDCVMVFGDCRPIHEAARLIAHNYNLQFWAFEEGYVRPNFVTLEPHGVNGHSKLPTDAESYQEWQSVDLPAEQHVPKSFWRATGYAICYFAATILMRWRFPLYRHHRRVSWLDGMCWIRALWRKWAFQLSERNALKGLQGHGGSQPYFLSVLQVAIDSQVRHHSRFVSISHYIEETVRSFAARAPSQAVLMIKHHPMDRGYTDYTRLIGQLRYELGLGERLRYIHDQHLPTLMAHAQGLVTINSTVGLSAFDHALPVKTLGQAIYDIPGLTSQRSLDDFWHNAACDQPDLALHAKFLNYVISHTQLNGNFYRELPGSDAAGLHYHNDTATHPSPLFTQLKHRPSQSAAFKTKLSSPASAAAS